MCRLFRLQRNCQSLLKHFGFRGPPLNLRKTTTLRWCIPSSRIRQEKQKVGLHMQKEICCLCVFFFLIWKFGACVLQLHFMHHSICIGRCGPFLTLFPGVAINKCFAIGTGDEETGDHCCDCGCTKLPPGRHSTWAL